MPDETVAKPKNEDDPLEILKRIGLGAAEGAGTGAPGGPIGTGIGAAVGAGAEAARNIPWDKIFQILDQTAKAKKERDLYRGFAYAYQEISSKKKFLYDSLIRGIAKDDSRIEHLKLRLDAIQYDIEEALKKLDRGDKDAARTNLQRLIGELKELREYISKNF